MFRFVKSSREYGSYQQEAFPGRTVVKLRSICVLIIFVLIVSFGIPVLVYGGTAAAQGEPRIEPKPLNADMRPARVPRGAGDGEEAQPTGPQGQPLVAPHLDFRLVGTVVADDPERSLAVMENASTGEQRGYTVGDRVGEVLIKEILFGKVVIQTSLGEGVVSMKSKGTAEAFLAPPHGSQLPIARVDKQEFDSALPDYTKLMREIRMRPRFSGGRPDGFVIYNIAPESPLDRMGLKDGDVIVGVNDESFSTTQPVVEFYEALKAGGTVSFRVERDGDIQDLRIEFTE